MKSYIQVVNERFDNATDNHDSIYNLSHPIGKYILKYINKEIDFVFAQCFNSNIVLSNKSIIDLGCGEGDLLKYFVSKGFKPENANGVDLAEKRIAIAKKKYPEIHFIKEDVFTRQTFEKKYFLISAFNLFSHFKEREEIESGLKIVKAMLETEGLFIWFDIYSKDHFNSPLNAVSWGFSKEQMCHFAEGAGFEIVCYRELFKNFFGKFQSVYQVGRLPAQIVKFLEKVLPGTPCNMLLVLKHKA